jgi:proton-translocating NAD(P)+ transhydrogenase subunit alpha
MSTMILGLLREAGDEKRVSLLPEVVKKFVQMKVEVWMESGAGAQAFASDESYIAEGAQIKNSDEIFDHADILLHIRPFTQPQLSSLKKGVIILGEYQPFYHLELIKKLADAGVTVISLDSIPRTTRAQSMDVLSSQANIAGYKAVLVAAVYYPRYFPMFMTAAGSVTPAKVLILGAGVAGLQAIATARRLGAVVEVFDTRPAVKEEVMSLGGRFIEVEGAADASSAGGYAVEQSEDFKRRQKTKIAESITKADVVITTAQIYGKKAPLLVTREMIDAMKPGSVIIDLASATGGNTEVTKDKETITYNHVTVIGNSALAATLPSDASKLYGKNVLNFLKLMITNEGVLSLPFDDDIVDAACIAHEGKIRSEKILEILQKDN